MGLMGSTMNTTNKTFVSLVPMTVHAAYHDTGSSLLLHKSSTAHRI